MTSNYDRPNLGIGFIGLGVLGKGLSLALAHSGHQVLGAHSRTPESAVWAARRIKGCQVFSHAQQLCDKADLVFITTPDVVIGQVASEISWRPGQGVVHCCGAAGEELLEQAAVQGAVTGAFHPCQTFACLDDPAGSLDRLKGVTFAVTGNGWVLEYLRGLATALGGYPITVPDGQRPRYHVASVMACGHLAALLNGAVRVWEEMGFTQEQAVRALYPLCRSTLENVASHGPVEAATGPVIRGDTATVKTHQEALAGRLDDLIPQYAELTRASLRLARTKGLAESQIEEIKDLLEGIRQAGQD